eukprot:CAMPEP_0170460074 /NCGR_PEP_ID=MMETSP0123-20130129/6563_1 /TAXON_ID=182087 /ORGANISM="Favella ehrenbergii, Strain Fehren 1" /LENGTH=35 /DNA_ID= /DNA_START= /DNA_END= /DNA_ORIENTATION=
MGRVNGMEVGNTYQDDASRLLMQREEFDPYGIDAS